MREVMKDRSKKSRDHDLSHAPTEGGCLIPRNGLKSAPNDSEYSQCACNLGDGGVKQYDIYIYLYIRYISGAGTFKKPLAASTTIEADFCGRKRPGIPPPPALS